MKRFASDQLTIDDEHNFKYNKRMIITEEDELYHEANITCHICNKMYEKVRGHSRETGKDRRPTCKVVSLSNNVKKQKYLMQKILNDYRSKALIRQLSFFFHHKIK